MSKGPNAFRTISEAADEVGVPQHVLRFWETKFSFIKPLKRAGGRRFYRPQDVAVLKGVRRLLHDEGLTIKGVQRLHRDQGLRRVAHYGDPAAAVEIAEHDGGGDGLEAAATQASPKADEVRLRRVLAEIETARSRLDALLQN